VFANRDKFRYQNPYPEMPLWAQIVSTGKKLNSIVEGTKTMVECTNTIVPAVETIAWTIKTMVFFVETAACGSNQPRLEGVALACPAQRGLEFIHSGWAA
jgi:hypothetical protein